MEGGGGGGGDPHAHLNVHKGGQGQDGGFCGVTGCHVMVT
jgi:hypothetical protein